MKSSGIMIIYIEVDKNGLLQRFLDRTNAGPRSPTAGLNAHFFLPFRSFFRKTLTFMIEFAKSGADFGRQASDEPTCQVLWR